MLLQFGGFEGVFALGMVFVAIGLGNAVEGYLGGTEIEGITAALVGLAALAYYAMERRQGGATGDRGVDETSA